PASRNVRVLQRHGQVLLLLGGEFRFEDVEWNDAQEDGGNENVDEGGNEHLADDTARQVPRTVPRFLGDSRDCIETDVSEEDDRRPGLNPRPAVWKKRMKVIAFHVRPSYRDEKSENDQL